MYYLLTLFIGVLIAVMTVCNGALTSLFGLYSATVFIHIVGMACIGLSVLVRRENPFSKRCSWYLYLGGALGVGTTAATNMAFGSISVSAILALSLFGQAVTSIFTDQIGFMGMTRHPFRKHKLIGLSLVGGGIIIMLTDFKALVVILPFLAGVSLVISRTLNACLAEETSGSISTFYNYLIGLSTAVIVLLLAGRREPLMTAPVFSADLYIYIGGALGVATVFLSNVVVAKISAFYMTLFLFVGQVFSALILDFIIDGAFSVRNLIGGLLVAAGLSVNLVLEKRTETKSFV